MPDFSQRSAHIEIMDDLTSSGPVIDQTLYELEVINKWLGGNAVTLNGLEKLLKRNSFKHTITIADLGCGGGDMLRLINNWATKRNISVDLIGFDANSNIIDYANKNVRSPNIHFRSLDIFSDEFNQLQFDVVIGTLFFHHFSKEALVQFFKQLRNQVKVGIIINDIHRHPIAYYSIAILTRLFSRSPMVIHDAPLSVVRAFTKAELENIFQEAGYKKYSIHWKWAFRWEVVLYPS